MNTFLNQVYEQLQETIEWFPLEEGRLPVLAVVEVLKEKQLITDVDYALFITEERSYGSIYGVIKEYQFSFSDITFENTEQPSGIPEDEMFYRIFSLINAELKEMKKRYSLQLD